MGITKEEAAQRLAAFEASRSASQRTSLQPLDIVQFAGEWIAARPLVAFGARLEGGGEPIAFGGALGTFVPVLGLPQSPERILGSSWRGRYQEFERGVANWEVLRDSAGNERQIGPVPNFPFPILVGEYSPKRGENVNALVAFFDLRGFTKWSGGATPERIQEVVTNLEIAFQDAFDPDVGYQVFAKGTGDGFMVVSEAGWFDATKDAVLPDHAKAFLDRCERTVDAAMASLDRAGLKGELAVGCGITVGPVTRAYILGRFDYLGAVVNKAAKLQNHARDEVCIDDAVLALLREHNPEFKAEPIAVPGWKVTK
jgi:class 3 adenylate cyclase